MLHDLAAPERSVVYGELVRHGPEDRRQLLTNPRRQVTSHELRSDYVANYYFTAKLTASASARPRCSSAGNGKLEGGRSASTRHDARTGPAGSLQSLLPQPPAARAPEALLPVEPEHTSVMIENLMDGIFAGSAESAAPH